MVLVLRGHALWETAVPQLKTSRTVYHPISVHKVSLNPGKHLGECFDDSAWTKVQSLLGC
jgi:hypothetical protein